MSAAVKLEYILQQISTLDNDSKIQVVEKILTMLKSDETKKNLKRNLTELKGLGAEIWKDIDVDTYLKSEREWD